MSWLLQVLVPAFHKDQGVRPAPSSGFFLTSVYNACVRNVEMVGRRKHPDCSLTLCAPCFKSECNAAILFIIS